MRRLLLAALFAAAPANAVVTPAAPSFTIPVPGTTAAADPSLAGTVVSDTLTPFMSASGPPIRGTVQVRTVRGADGKLAFYWKVNNEAASAGNVTGLLVLNVPLARYDANWRVDGLGTIAPTNVVALNTGGIQMVGFGFGPAPIHPGESSRFMFLKTDVTSAQPTSAIVTLSTGGYSVPFAALKPGPK